MTWDFDMDGAPRRGYGDGRKEILIAIKDEKRVVVAFWLPHDHTNREGYWSGVKPNETPLAWCDIDYPIMEKHVTLPPGIGVVK